MQNVLSDQELACALTYDLKIAILGGKKFYRLKLSSGSGRFSGGKFYHFSGGKIEIFKEYKLENSVDAHKDLEGRKILGPAVIIP